MKSEIQAWTQRGDDQVNKDGNTQGEHHISMSNAFINQGRPKIGD
jgi:hypothetical protein